MRPLTADADERLCIYGAMNGRTGPSHYLVHPKKNAVQFHESLRQLPEANTDRRVVPGVDNAGYHRTKAILDPFAGHADHCFVLRLPRHSPEPNPIEGPWGCLKRSALNDYFFGDTDTLERAVHDTSADPQRHPQTTPSLACKHATQLRQTA